MTSAASIAKHPIHPMLIPIPIGLWLFSLFSDLMALSTGNIVWDSCALYTMMGGVLGALLAALPGLLDLYRMRPSRAKTLGIWHMGINVTVVLLYVLNVLWRLEGALGVGQVILSGFAVLLLCISGWLGGEMVYVHGVAVARVDDPDRAK